MQKRNSFRHIVCGYQTPFLKCDNIPKVFKIIFNLNPECKDFLCYKALPGSKFLSIPETVKQGVGYENNCVQHVLFNLERSKKAYLGIAMGTF